MDQAAELSDADVGLTAPAANAVFAPGAPAGVAPTQAQENFARANNNPQGVAYDYQGSQAAPQQAHVTPSGQLVDPGGVTMNPSAQGEMTDQQVFGATPGAQNPNPTRSDEMLGFEREAMRPLDNAALWAEQGLEKIGVPVSSWEHALGQPSAADAYNAHNQVVADAAKQGVVPGKIGGFLGSMVGTAPLAALPGGPLVQGAATGLATTQNPDDLGQTAASAGLGALGGQIAHSAIGAATDLVAPKLSDAARFLIQRGVPVTSDKLGPNPLLGLAGRVASITPIAGELQRTAGDRAILAANKALGNEAVAPMGVALPADTSPGGETVDAVRQLKNQAYDAVGAAAPEVPLTGNYAAQMQGIKQTVQGLPPDLQTRYNNLVQRELVGRLDPTTGGYTGQGLTDAKAALNNEISKVNPQNPWDHDYLAALKDTRSAVLGMLSDANPAARAALSTADQVNQGYQVLKDTAANSTKRQTTGDGIAVPQQIQQAVNRGSTTYQKATGDGWGQEFASAAKSALPSRINTLYPDVFHGLGEGLVTLGVGKEAFAGNHGLAAAAPVVGLSALYSPPMQELLRRSAMARAAGVNPIVTALQAGQAPASFAAANAASPNAGAILGLLPAAQPIAVPAN